MGFNSAFKGLIPTLDGDEWSVLRLGRFTHGNHSVPMD